MDTIKDLNFYKNNCEEDYVKTPISVLRYITELEQALQLRENAVISSVFSPEWLTYDIRKKVKDLWDLPNENNSNPRTSAIKLIREIAKHNGYEIDLKKSVELVKQHCL